MLTIDWPSIMHRNQGGFSAKLGVLLPIQVRHFPLKQDACCSLNGRDNPNESSMGTGKGTGKGCLPSTENEKLECFRGSVAPSTDGICSRNLALS